MRKMEAVPIKRYVTNVKGVSRVKGHKNLLRITNANCDFYAKADEKICEMCGIWTERSGELPTDVMNAAVYAYDNKYKMWDWK